MEVLVTSIRNFLDSDNETKQMVADGLGLPDGDALKGVLDTIENHLQKLRPELIVIIETDYVDRGFRDSYYSYYSTKLENYDRNCIRLSLFENTLTPEDEIDEDFARKLQDSYLGFMIIRPLVNACIGRNVISPRAKRNCANLAICETKVRSSCMGYKLCVYGFPHSSQDGEMMTCAETTVWSMMEYFGNKYPIYTPTLPSTISGLNDTLSYERKIPSTGMYYDQISNVLKWHGFGCLVYDNTNPRFKELFTCYVESGFPLAVCLLDKDETIGHAVVCIGRKNVRRSRIRKVRQIKANKDNPTKLRSWNMAIDDFVFNDDNVPCYQIAKFMAPAKHYEDEEWNKVRITHFIVPLHKKIYVDAETAIDAANNLLVETIGVESGVVVRTFITTSRAYKDYVAKNEDFSQEEKQRLLTLDMAKFIWVTEYADMDTFCDNKANGIILMDATGHIDAKDISSIILYQKGTSGFVYNQQTRRHHEFENAMATSFRAFKNNLKNK